MCSDDHGHAPGVTERTWDDVPRESATWADKAGSSPSWTCASLESQVSTCEQATQHQDR